MPRPPRPPRRGPPVPPDPQDPQGFASEIARVLGGGSPPTPPVPSRRAARRGTSPSTPTPMSFPPSSVPAGATPTPRQLGHGTHYPSCALSCMGSADEAHGHTFKPSAMKALPPGEESPVEKWKRITGQGGAPDTPNTGSTQSAPGSQANRPTDAYNVDRYSKGTSPSHPTGKGIQSYTPLAGKILVIRPDGTSRGPYTVGTQYRDWWAAASATYMPSEGVMLIPEDCVDFDYAKPKFNACTYTATEDYLAARWGRKLHFTDRDWLAGHPLATDDGIPQAHTATCLQQLLQPYGMGVSRMRIRRGSLFPTATEWAQVLGCNPFGMIDHQTTNAEALDRMGITDAEQRAQFDALWRLEFHDAPLPCSVIGERGWSNQAGVNVGTAGGHARYLAPRSSAGDWTVSLQFAPLEQVQYLVSPPDPAYEERRGDATLMLGSVRGPDGMVVAVKHNGFFLTPTEYLARTVKATGGTSTTSSSSSAPSSPTLGREYRDTPQGPIDERFQRELALVPPGGYTPTGKTPGVQYCPECNQPTEDKDFVGELPICEWCYTAAWKGLSCPTCEVRFDFNTSPDFLARGDSAGETVFGCVRCKTELSVKDDRLGDALYQHLRGLISVIVLHEYSATPATPTATSPSGDPADVPPADHPATPTTAATVPATPADSTAGATGC